KVKTLGGKMFWNEIAKKGEFRVQQNVISQHFRILDDNDYRWYSTFEEDEVMKHFHELVNE
ncbi:TPA: transcriptional regulator, partial [Bacillus cereus]